MCKSIALAGLLGLAFTACKPFPKQEETTPTQRATATPRATPVPTPQPGAWMSEKRDNPLGIKDRPFDQPARK